MASFYLLATEVLRCQWPKATPHYLTVDLLAKELRRTAAVRSLHIYTVSQRLGIS